MKILEKLLNKRYISYTLVYAIIPYFILIITTVDITLKAFILQILFVLYINFLFRPKNYIYEPRLFLLTNILMTLLGYWLVSVNLILFISYFINENIIPVIDSNLNIKHKNLHPVNDLMASPTFDTNRKRAENKNNFEKLLKISAINNSILYVGLFIFISRNYDIFTTKLLSCLLNIDSIYILNISVIDILIVVGVLFNLTRITLTKEFK